MKNSFKFLMVFFLFGSYLYAQNQSNSSDINHYELLKKINLNYLKDGSKAKKTLDSLQPILIKKANDSLLGLYFRVLSNVKSNQLEKEEALKEIDKSIRYFKKAKNKRGEVLSSLNKGNLFLMKGETKLAMKIYSEALFEAQKNDLKYEEAILCKNIGVLFFNQNKTQEALSQYQRALKIFLKINNVKEIANTYTNIGNVYYNEYDSKNALLNYNKAMKLTIQIKDSVNLAKLCNNIGSVYIDDEHDTIKGLSYLLKSLDLKTKLNEKNDLIFAYENLATVYIGLKKFDLAEDYLKKANDMALKSGNKEELKEIYENYSLLYEGKNDYKKANEYYRMYVKVKDTLLNIENLKAVEEIKTKYQTAEKEKIILQKEIENKKKTNWLILFSVLTIASILLGYLFYHQQKLKNKQQEQEFQLKTAIAQIETQNQLQEQRLAISRDLHDNIGAQLTFVISSVDNLKYGNQISDSRVVSQLTKISDFTKSTIIELRDTIWAMNNNEFSFEDLRSRIFNFIEKAKSAKEDIVFKFNVDESLKEVKFSSIIGINLYRTIQEAVNNAVKYSDAKEIEVIVSKQNEATKIVIKDNGKGFDVETVDFGNGLNNMRKRIEEIGGKITISSNSKGTVIEIVI